MLIAFFKYGLKKYDRFIEPIAIEKGFHFVKKPETRIIETDHNGKPSKKLNIFYETPDFGILRAGGGKKCGRLSQDYENGIACYSEGSGYLLN